MKQSDTGLLELLLSISDMINGGTMWLNADGHIVYVNEDFAHDLGFPKQAFVPKTIFEVNPQTSLLSWRKLWKRVLEEKQVTISTEQITADEVIYPVQMRIMLIELEDEQLCMCVVENLMEANRFLDLLNITSEISGTGSWEWNLAKSEFIATNEMYHLLDVPTGTFHSFNDFRSFLKERVNEEEGKILEKNLNLAIEEGKPIDIELSISSKNKFENFHLIAQPVTLEDQTNKIYGTLQNLNKVAKRTDDLYFMKFCMENARDMIYWIERDGAISYVNNRVCRVLGYSYDELIKMNVKDLNPDSKIDLEEHWTDLKEQQMIEFESIHISKSGQEIPVSIIPNYVNYKGREFNCAFVRDLSKKQKRDEDIKLAKQSLDQSIDMIFWTRPDGTFRYFNDAFIRKSGYSKKELGDLKVFDLFIDNNLEQFKEEWENLRQGNPVESLGRMLKTKEGKIIPAEMTAALLTLNDKVYSTSVLRDISERKRQEAELHAYLQKIEQLQKDTEAENIELKEELNTEFNFDNIVSRDPNYKKVLKQIVQVADTEATVLILGETGTGKELLARAIHSLSERSDASMIKVNCGALPENLIESELFGHEKGSFTGAHQRKIGKFERADKGTIFLDEIGELPLELQSKLLRVLQEGEIERVGGTELLHIDVRIIAATNRNLDQLVQEGKFREDLFYRLNVFPIVNLPLRERPEDIPILVKHFVEKYSKKLNKEITEISQSGMNKLKSYSFLGNVRELENMVERAIILCRSNVLTFDKAIFKKSTSKSTKFKTLEEMQRDHIIEALKLTKGKVSGEDGAAVLLGMNDKTLSSRMRKLGIGRKEYQKG